MIAIASLFRSILIFPLVLLSFSTPKMITRMSSSRLVNFVMLELTTIAMAVVFAYYFFWNTFLDVLTSQAFLLCLVAFLTPAFLITFKQVYGREKSKRAITLDKIKNSCWRPYAAPVIGETVNIELKNGRILWHVPSEKLEVLHDEVKLWMPVPGQCAK